jgi:hypothetical protein
MMEFKRFYGNRKAYDIQKVTTCFHGLSYTDKNITQQCNPRLHGLNIERCISVQSKYIFQKPSLLLDILTYTDT